MGYRLTKSIVDSIPLPANGQGFYRDAELKGFGLRVGCASKVYFAEGKVNNRTVRVTIGKHGVFTAEQARNQARVILGQIAKGILGVSVAFLERDRWAGAQVPFIRIGARAVRYSLNDLNAFIESRRRVSTIPG